VLRWLKYWIIICGVAFLLSSREYRATQEEATIEFEPDVINIQPITMPHEDPIGSFDKDAAERRALVSHAVFIIEDLTILGLDKSIVGSSGTGTVIALDEDVNESLILTASHVCVNAFSVGDLVNEGIVLSIAKYIVTVDGRKLKARVLYRDIANDICAMETTGLAGEPAIVATSHPPRQAYLLTAGAPKGNWGADDVNVVYGFFSGINKSTILGYSGFYHTSIPVTSGMSGSGVYYKGKLVAILTIANMDYPHLSWGPGIDKVAPFIDYALRNWNEKDPVNLGLEEDVN